MTSGKKTMTDADYADNLGLLTNTPIQAEPLLQSLEQTARCIELSVNANKIEFKCFKQKGANFILSDKPLNLVDHFT